MGTRIRRARHGDIEQLVEMRRDLSLEGLEPDAANTRTGYEDECRAFLEDAISGGRWHVWIAEADERIVSHAFVALVEKVPRPIRDRTRIAYLTNVYTRPAFRGQGVGTEIIRHVQAAARDADVELIIVWPSDESVDFYEHSGFKPPDEPLIWTATDND